MSEHSLYYIPILLLVIFGVSKIVGLITANKTIRRFSIVGLMFCWGFVWISSLLNFIAVSPNRTTITTIPIIAISIFIATRGDYTDD